MEFVDSRPIDRWCDEGKLNVTQRLQLFRSACDAVQYAHQRLIVRGFLLRKTLRRSTEEIEHRIMRHRGFLVSLRDTRPERYEKASMAHYSVFYFLGRAAKRFAQEETAHDQPLVRVLNRIAGRAEQLQTLGHVQLPLVAPPIDRPAVDKLHHEDRGVACRLRLRLEASCPTGAARPGGSHHWAANAV